MKNCRIILLLRLVPGLLALSFMGINAQDVTGSWSGTVTLHETVTYDLGNNDRQITIFFTDNKGTGTVAGNGEYIVGGKLFCKSSCSGSGDAELHEVTIDKDAGTYRIHVISPRSTCTNTGPFCSEPTTDNGFVDIIVSERPLDNSPNVLSGSETRVSDLAANGKVFTTITWNLVGSTDIEEPCIACGSVIRIENQSLGQTIAIAGTPFSLSYRSDRIITSSIDEIGGWTLSSHHNFIGNRLYLGNGNEFAIRDDLKAVAEEIPKVVSAGGYLIASGDGSEMYAFNNSGLHLRTLDALTGSLIYEFQYDSKERLTTIIDAFGLATTIERGSGGSPTAIIGPYGHRTNIKLDSAYNLINITNPAGEKILFAYSTSRLLTSMIDSRDFSHTFEYDPAGRLIRNSGPSGSSTSTTRVGSNNDYTINLTTGLGRTTKYNVVKQANGVLDRIVTFADGSTNKETKWPDGKEKVKFADGTVEIRTAPSNLLGGHQSPLPALVTIQLPGGLMSKLAAKRSIVLENTLNPLSISSLVDSLNLNGNVAKSIYTAATRTLTELSPLGRQQTTMFDNNGQIIKRHIAGLIPLVYKYDIYGRLVGTNQETNSEVREYHYTYDPEGNLDTMIDPLGRASSFRYDAVGRTTQISLPDRFVIGFTYDNAGNITSFKPPNRPSHTFEYNAFGLLVKYNPPDVGNRSNSTSYEYNADKNLTRILRPDGKTISFSYDLGGCQCGKVSRLIEPRGTHSYTYNKTTGLLTSLSSPDGITLSISYDGDIPTNQTWSGPIKANVKNEYDNSFQIVSRTVNGTAPISYKTDADGLLVKAGNLVLERDPLNGRIISMELGKIVETKVYNTFGEKTDAVVTFDKATLYSAQYKHDKLGRVVTKIETIGGVTDTFIYGYDLVGRLATSTKKGNKTATFTYDENGNCLTIVTYEGSHHTATYDNQDRLIQSGINAYTYTANGELSKKSDGTITSTYNYDVFGNLITVTLPDSMRIDYIVDGLNRRIGRKVNGVLRQGFIYQDELRIVAELEGDNKIVSRYVYASRMNIPDYMIRNGITYRIISDNTGSPRLVVDVNSGTVAQRMDYDEFGNVIEDSNPGLQPFGFAGGLYDPDTRLTRFGVRDYDASTGRWTAKDPILFGGYQANLYAYVGNDPLNQKDPTGRGVRVCWQGLLGFDMPKHLSHWWLETSTVKRGMGNPWGGMVVAWTDQSSKYRWKGEKITCEDYPTVDEECVNKNTRGDLGIYGFIINNCQDAVIEVLKKCGPGSPPPEKPDPIPMRKGSY